MIVTEVVVQPLTRPELPGAFALSTLMGWNQRLEDWHMLTSLAPAGTFAAHAAGRIVGTAIGIDYGAFGWIAMMLVDPDYRNRGLGARLLESALAVLPPGLPVRLDATPLGRPLYERYGFQLEDTLTRHLRPEGAPAHDGGGHAEPMKQAAIASIATTDRDVFGSDRIGVLQWMRAEAPEYAWRDMSRPEAPQYCLGRCGRLADHLGPIVAGSEDDAAGLAAAALSCAGSKPVIIDAYDRHAGFLAWLRGAGFEAQRPLYRMRRGRDFRLTSLRQASGGPPERSARRRKAEATRSLAFTRHEFAILGPEFG